MAEFESDITGPLLAQDKKCSESSCQPFPALQTQTTPTQEAEHREHKCCDDRQDETQEEQQLDREEKEPDYETVSKSQTHTSLMIKNPLQEAIEETNELLRQSLSLTARLTALRNDMGNMQERADSCLEDAQRASDSHE